MTIAIIKTGGKQYKVKEGQTISIEKLDGAVGGKINFNEVLLIADEKENLEIGQPFVNKTVQAEIVEQGRADKVVVLKFKSKVRYRRKYGHRQPFTKVKILKIGAGPAEAKGVKKTAAKKVVKKKITAE